MADPSTLDLLRAVLDPGRLAVLGAAASGRVDISTLSDATGMDRRAVARAIGDLRAIGLLRADGSLDTEALRSIAKSLPGGPNERGEPVSGPWSEAEARILGRFFDGGRLREIPTAASKRKLVVEKVALEFEPGRRYTEREVDFIVQLIHDDYASIRRYMIDDGFMDRADGAYWRTGGRYGPPTDSVAVEGSPGDPITTSRPDVVLRPWNWGMIDALIEVADDERIPTYMGDMFPYPYTREAAEMWLDIATGAFPPTQYAIYVEGSLAGGVGAFALEAEKSGGAEIGWWLNPAWWGSGVTTAAVAAFIDEMFSRDGVERLWAPVMEPNVASARVAEKAGMRLEGIAPSLYVKRGVRMDALNFGITRSQWTAR